MRVRNPEAPRVLEVAVRWGETLIDVQRADRKGLIHLHGLGAVAIGPLLPDPLAFGPLRLETRWADPAVPLHGLEGVDLRYLELLAFAFAFHLALVLAIWMQPAEDEGLSEGLFNRPDVMHAVLVRAAHDTEKFPAVLGAEGSHAPRPDGKRGRPEATRERAPVPRPRTIARQRELDRAHHESRTARRAAGPGGF
jgi:hypothetical protein